MISQSILKENLQYNKITGVFNWVKTKTNKSKKGDFAGNLNSDNYVRITIDYKNYPAHRLAWLYEYGQWPKNQIDHINGIRNDNRIENLREVTCRVNAINRKEHRLGHLPGTTYLKDRKKWRASIQISGKIKYLGYYETQELAHKAYLNKVKELNKWQLLI